MTYADGALRLGVLYDLLGRFHHLDMRDSTVGQFMRRYQVEADQANGCAPPPWRPSTSSGRAPPTTATGPFLGWAANLHEIGISVAHNAYHKHGAYILTYADMPGFSKKDQARLAMLVLGHRANSKSCPPCPPATAAGASSSACGWRCSCTAPATTGLAAYRLQATSRVELDLPADWLAQNP